MALRQGQREVRIEVPKVLLQLQDLHGVGSDERLVGSSMPYADPPVVVFLVEKLDDQEGS